MLAAAAAYCAYEFEFIRLQNGSVQITGIINTFTKLNRNRMRDTHARKHADIYTYVYFLFYWVVVGRLHFLAIGGTTTIYEKCYDSSSFR